MIEKTWYAEERFRGDGWMILSSEPFDIGRAATQVVALLDYSGPEAEKNARLMAAALGMYEALEEWEEPNTCGCDTFTCRDTCAPAKIRAALRKARGDQ